MALGWHLLLPVLLAVFSSIDATDAAAVDPPLPPGRVLLDSAPESFRLTGDAAGQAQAKIISASGPGFDRAWQIAVRKQPLAEYQIQMAARMDEKLHAGDSVLLTVWARSSASSGPEGQGCVGLVVEQSADPYDKVFSRRFTIGSDWQRLDVAAKITPNFSRTPMQAVLRLGYFPQTVEIGGVELREFDPSVPLAKLPQTPMTYRGREAGAAWRQEAEQRINSLRKSMLTVRVTDSAGNPVSEADVHVHMLRQAFTFGCVYNDGRFPAGGGDSPDDLAYQEHFTEMFNTGVDEAGMKWPGWEDPAKQQAALRALAWMRDHGIAVRGHNLVWPGWKRLPADLRAMASDPAGLEQRIDDHIRDEVSALAGKVTEWDVINEPYLNNDLMHVLGNKAMANWFKIARQADPDARLYLNETNVPTSPPADHRYDALYDEVRTLQSEGAPIGGIGMQSHFGDNLTTPVDLLAIYDRFAALGIPIRITELDIDTSDEQLQADYFRDFLIASYSDPEINGIMLWGFWEAQHWLPDAALFRKDWSIKPNGQVWKDLVLGKWRTNVDGKSGGDGVFSTRAFLGDYELTISAGGKSQTATVSLPAEGRTVDIPLK